MIPCKYDGCNRTGTSVLNITRHEQRCKFRGVALATTSDNAGPTTHNLLYDVFASEESPELSPREQMTSEQSEEDSLLGDILEMIHFSRKVGTYKVDEALGILGNPNFPFKHFQEKVKSMKDCSRLLKDVEVESVERYGFERCTAADTISGTSDHVEDFFYGYDKDFRKSGQKFTVRRKMYRAARDIQIFVREGSHPTTLRYAAAAKDIYNISVDVVIKITQLQHERFSLIGDDLSIVLPLDSISYSVKHDIWGIDRQRVMVSPRDVIGPDHVVKVEGAGVCLEGDTEKRGNLFVRFVRSV